MLSKPIDSAIKQRFQEILTIAEDKATREFDNLTIDIDNLGHFEKLKKLFEEDQRLDDLIEASPHPYYIRNYESGSLLTQFANRTFLLNVDESHDLGEAVFISKYHRLVFKAFDQLTDEIPQFTYDMFISGKESKYFGVFKSYYTTDEEHYNKIKNWRAKKLLQIVTYDYELLIRNIQNVCQSLEHPLEFILSEKEKAEDLLDEIELDANIIRERLSELEMLAGQNLGIFSDQLLIDNLNMYREGHLNWSSVYPKTVRRPLQLIRAKSKTLVSSEATLFYAIDKVASWMDDVIKELPLFEVIDTPDWGKLLTGIKSKATKEVERLTAIIEEAAYDPNTPKADIKDFLISQFNKYRLKFNAFKEQHIFYDLKRENSKQLKELFATNAFFSNDTEGISNTLYEAMLIQETIWVVVQIYADVFDTHKLGLIDNMEHFSIMGLLSQMVLDKDLYNEFSEALRVAGSHHESYFLPFEVHSQNLKESMHHTFHKAIQKLQSVLDDAEPSNKILYLQSRLKDLKEAELYSKEYEDDESLAPRKNKYFSLFKDFLSIEADFIKETRDITVLPPIRLTSKPPLLNACSQTFESLLSEHNRSFIVKMLEDLSITVDGKSVLTQRKKGAIRGVVDALQENNIGSSITIEVFCKIIAATIKLDLNSKLDYSNISKQFQEKSAKYIKLNYTKI